MTFASFLNCLNRSSMIMTLWSLKTLMNRCGMDGGNPNSPGMTSEPPRENLPLNIVDRGALAPAAPARNRPWRVLRLLLVLLLLPVGGVIGLYFQPPGVRFIMTQLGLEPGGGTADPIAVPREKPRPTEPRTEPALQTVAGLGLLLPESRVLSPRLSAQATPASPNFGLKKATGSRPALFWRSSTTRQAFRPRSHPLKPRFQRARRSCNKRRIM